MWVRLQGIAAVAVVAMVALVVHGVILGTSRGRSPALPVSVVLEGVVLGLAAVLLWKATRTRVSAVLALVAASGAVLLSVRPMQPYLEHFGRSPFGWLAITVLVLRIFAPAVESGSGTTNTGP